jgi:response regulator RpfG family c-di-GMP phosphodiesterase
VTEAENAVRALTEVRAAMPDLVILDVNMPGVDGLELCTRLKRHARTANLPVLLLTGSEAGEVEAARAGADAYLRKPFSPLELLALVERLAGGRIGIPFRQTPTEAMEDALLLYARDLRHVLEVERSQRAALASAYAQTVVALANALESKDTTTRAHSQRVQRYAAALAAHVEADLLADPSVEYGFLLHDVGKIGIPDNVLQKPAPLTTTERRLMQTHTVLGEQMLRGIEYLQIEGLRIVRSHHERWDGRGYPDGLAGEEIPLGARVFAVADALDAMTSDRPYRSAVSWEGACREVLAQRGRQFDPHVVDVFMEVHDELREIRRELATAA